MSRKLLLYSLPVLLAATLPIVPFVNVTGLMSGSQSGKSFYFAFAVMFLVFAGITYQLITKNYSIRIKPLDALSKRNPSNREASNPHPSADGSNAKPFRPKKAGAFMNVLSRTVSFFRSQILQKLQIFRSSGASNAKHSNGESSNISNIFSNGVALISIVSIVLVLPASRSRAAWLGALAGCFFVFQTFKPFKHFTTLQKRGLNVQNKQDLNLEFKSFEKIAGFINIIKKLKF
jgi:hypothetical protein